MQWLDLLMNYSHVGTATSFQRGLNCRHQRTCKHRAKHY